MTGPQPIRATAAVDYLRRIARGVCSRHGGRPTQLLEWRSADLIERQAAQIERMRAALAHARTYVYVDRESFVQCSADPYGVLDADDQAIAAEYDAVLKMIDEAMGETK